ncbi:MAG: glycosyltransferase family 4 protein [Desulfomonilaceae bacterium]
MNILMINPYAGSPIHGMVFRSFYLGREWVRLGHSVTIVATSYSHVRYRQPDIKGAISEEFIDGIRYVWLKAPTFQGNGLRRVMNMVMFVAQLYRNSTALAASGKPDIIVASSPHPLPIFPARWLAKRCGARLIFDVRDLWPLAPILLGGISKWHPFILLLQWAEDFAYRYADHVVSAWKKADIYMKERGMAGEKFLFIPNGILSDEWEDDVVDLPLEHSEALNSLFRAKHFVVGYAGAHGLANGLGALVDAAAALQGFPVTFVLVGQGPEKESLQQAVSRAHLENVMFLPPVPRAVIPSLLRSWDACYLGLKAGPLHQFGESSSKLMDYMMAGKPVIHAVDSGDDPVYASGCGISVPAEDSHAIACAVSTLLKMTPAEREAMGLKGHQYVRQHYDMRHLAKKFLESVSSS